MYINSCFRSCKEILTRVGTESWTMYRKYKSENAKHINVEPQCLCSEVSLRAPYRKPRDWNLKSIMSFVRIIYNWLPFEKEYPRVDQWALIEPLITALNTMIVLVIWFHSSSDLRIEVISDWSVLSWPEAQPCKLVEFEFISVLVLVMLLKLIPLALCSHWLWKPVWEQGHSQHIGSLCYSDGIKSEYHAS